jgi:hypothetical protein
LKIGLVDKNSGRYSALQDFVRREGLFFNSEKWLSIYPSANIKQAAILNNNDEIIGCFVFYTYKRALLRMLITPPYCPHIEFYCVNPSKAVVARNSFEKELAQLLALFLKEQKADVIDLHLPVEFRDVQPLIWNKIEVNTRYTYLLDLVPPKEQLWDQLSSEKRKSINKAIKDGLEITETRDLETVHRLIVKSLERNSVHRNKEILCNILFVFSDPQNSIAFVAKRGHEAIGASFCLYHHKKAVYLFGGFDSSNSHHGAGVSCMWHSILKAKEAGLQIFDFEGSMNPAIERYFREFGGTLTPYFSIEQNSRRYKILKTLKK